MEEIKCMQKNILMCLLLGMSLTYSMAQNDTIPQTIAQQNEAKKVAGEWFSQLIAGKNIDAVMAVSALPFAMDGKILLNTKKELRDFYRKIIEDKGARKIPEFITEIHGFKHEILDKYIPVNVLVVKIKITDKNRSKGDVLVSVGISDTKIRVIGFSD